MPEFVNLPPHASAQVNIRPPSYQAPEDPNYKCNFDRLMEALTVKVSKDMLRKMKLKDFFAHFQYAAIFGVRAELLNEQTLQPEIYTFLPTLSSIFLDYTKVNETKLNKKVNTSGIVKHLNFDQISEEKELESKGFQDPEAAFEAELEKSLLAMESGARRFFEYHEREPHYFRRPFSAKINELLKEQLGLEQI